MLERRVPDILAGVHRDIRRLNLRFFDLPFDRTRIVAWIDTQARDLQLKLHGTSQHAKTVLLQKATNAEHLSPSETAIMPETCETLKLLT